MTERRFEKRSEMVLSVSNLNVTYWSRERSLRALRDFNLEVNKGETVGLLGESGAGKSTVGMALLRMIERPSLADGEIRLQGKDVTKLSGRELEEFRWNDVAIVFQAAMNSLDPVVTVGKNFVELLRDKKIAKTKEQASAEARRLLGVVGLPDSTYWLFPFELSGGMKQRVLIAMALAANPKLLIADEPTTALDTITQFSVLQLIKRLKDEGALQSVLLISHDISVQVYMADRLVVMLKGRVVETASKGELLASPMHPYTKVLLGEQQGGGPPAEVEVSAPPNEDSCPFSNQCRFVMPKCIEKMPVLTESGPDHIVACYLYGG